MGISTLGVGHLVQAGDTVMWGEFLARIVLACNLDPLIDVETLVSLAHASCLLASSAVTEEEVEEWLTTLG